MVYIEKKINLVLLKCCQNAVKQVDMKNNKNSNRSIRMSYKHALHLIKMIQTNHKNLQWS